MSKEYIKAQTPLPAYFPYPKFLLQMSLSHTARLTYVLLLDRMTLSQKNGWVDVQGRAYVLYPLAGLAEDLQSSISSVTRALRELEAARLIERRSNGFSKPNQVFLSFPSTAQKCTVEMVKNEQPDCSKVSNPLTGEMKKKQMKFFPDAYKNRIGKSYNDYIADHQMNMFEDFIGYQSSTVLDEPEREAGTTSIPIPQREESENIPLPDLPGQLENVQQSGNEIAKRGMPT